MMINLIFGELKREVFIFGPDDVVRIFFHCFYPKVVRVVRVGYAELDVESNEEGGV